ncbi:MAG: FHA domain-containing protein [Bdellovibrionota bacterium]
MILFKIEKNKETLFYYRPRKDEITIGRDKTNDLCLMDPFLSRHQGLIIPGPKAFIYRDLSKNGSFINGKRVFRDQELDVDDRIEMGPWTLTLETFSHDREEVTLIRNPTQPTKILEYRAKSDEIAFQHAWLETIAAPFRQFFLEKEEVTLGQAPSNDIVLFDPYISFTHCKIINQEGKYIIKDMASTNGTHVGQQKIVQAHLDNGDVIRIGRQELRFFSDQKTKKILPADQKEFCGIVSDDRTMKKHFSLIKALQKSNATVLLQGETGSGKELFAQAIHEWSGRKEHPWVAINCGAVSKDLIESELFGHEKGAFTSAHRAHTGLFEQAHQGTLFLDEAELPPAFANQFVARP